MSTPAQPIPRPAGIDVTRGSWRERWRHGPVATQLVIGVPVLALAMALTALNVGGHVLLWENLHWTIAEFLAFSVAWTGARQAGGTDRIVRHALALGLFLYLVGQVVWLAQVSVNFYAVPAPSDAFFLASAFPIIAGFGIAVHRRLTGTSEAAVYLDAAMVFLAVTAVIVAVFGSELSHQDPLAAAVAAAYGVLFLATAGGALVIALAMQTKLTFTGVWAVLGGSALLGIAWVLWIVGASTTVPPPGSLVNYLFSFGSVVLGMGAATWRSGTYNPVPGPGWPRVSSALRSSLPLIGVAVTVVVLAADTTEHGADAFVSLAAGGAVMLAIARQTLLLREVSRFVSRERIAAQREREAAKRERTARDDALAALDAHRASEARYRAVVDVFNRLGEQMTLASDEPRLVKSAAGALHRLVPSARGNVLIMNASEDRLTVSTVWGAGAPEKGAAAAVDSPAQCLGIRRGSVYVVDDVADDLQMPCPAHAADRGSVMCVPMVALGGTVGVVHLERSERSAFSRDDQRQAARVAEQVALAVANARLVGTMERMALTDPITGLHNARFFDPFLDKELAIAERDGGSVGLIAIDLDHFKAFNDTHGHPAGDQALRAFSAVARRALRASDTITRYGGEEFMVAVRHGDLDETRELAERLRRAVEALVVDIGPGRTATITMSAGVASTAAHGKDRLTLMRVADQALYRAKQAGRNRVVVADG